MTAIRDVTSQVVTGEIDDEILVITKCICGKQFSRWVFYISIYPENPYACPACGRKFVFSSKVTIYEVLDDASNTGSELQCKESKTE